MAKQVVFLKNVVRLKDKSFAHFRSRPKVVVNSVKYSSATMKMGQNRKGVVTSVVSFVIISVVAMLGCEGVRGIVVVDGDAGAELDTLVSSLE